MRGKDLGCVRNEFREKTVKQTKIGRLQGCQARHERGCEAHLNASVRAEPSDGGGYEVL